MKITAHIGLIRASILTALLAANEATLASEKVYDSDPVNGHAGYLTAWRVAGKLDKPVIMVKGYDTVNNAHPIDDLNGELGNLAIPLSDRGFDIIVFDYVDGKADLKNNADNLAEFVRYLDGLIAASGAVDGDGDGHPDYELAIIGGSMGGIVARTMFVQENSAMGVDIFVTIDSPHHGVQLSPFLDWATAFLDTVAGHQMLYGDAAYFAHYNWLRSVESTTEFRARIIDPMHTAAIAFSDGESAWHLDSGNILFHTEFHDVSSFIEKENIESDYVPYHSAVNMDNTAVEEIDRGWDYVDLRYVTTHTSYFDRKIPNPRAIHDQHDYAIRQAIDFVIEYGGRPIESPATWLIPTLDLLLR